MGFSWNRYISLIKEAFSELFSSKINVLFMSFGLIVGISAMSSIHSLGKGTEATIIKVLESLNFGSNSFLILAGGGKFFGPATTREDTFKMDDVKYLQRLDFVVGISPVQFGIMKVSTGSVSETTRVLGVFPVYAQINNWGASEGRFITWKDIREKSKVCVLGYETAKKLFPSSSALGKKVEIEGVKFEVVGILERKGVVGRYRLDDRVLIPFSTAEKRVFNRDWINAAKVLMVRGVDLKRAKRVVEKILRKRHHLRPDEENDFRIITPDQIVAFLTKASKTLTFMLFIISIITLIVSGVIIMNIMYAVVEEKKKIIALRMALGAKVSDIIFHYLFISLFVSLFGGLIGFFSGLGIGFLISQFSPIKAVYDLWFIFPSLTFSFFTGFIFGILPARKASKLPPAELLR